MIRPEGIAVAPLIREMKKINAFEVVCISTQPHSFLF